MRVRDGRFMGFIERLYVCKWCFKYCKEVVVWLGHARACERRPLEGVRDGEREVPMVPGRRIYTHAKSGEGGGEGVWSVWEVDGEVDPVRSFIHPHPVFCLQKETETMEQQTRGGCANATATANANANLAGSQMYCQNLSLFAKLFLDNKSVFFDVTGFNYFLLVHTDPATRAQQVIGFFSKEKQSWDCNNLACILIFPPWQKKSLGSLLIALSYEISRREGLLGGPEKPISDIGKKGYVKYWCAQVARYLLDAKDTNLKRGSGRVSVEDISRETWMLQEDVLTALREMSVAVNAGKGKGEVARVKIDKEKVREWVERNHVDLRPAIDVQGFVEGYGYKEEYGDEEMGD